MTPTSVCIVAHYMSRSSERARINAVPRAIRVLSVAVVSCAMLGSVAGCDEVKARNQVRQGNRMFRDTMFIDAAAEYQQALTVVDHPIIHYNLGLTYSKIFKNGYDGPILLGTADEALCRSIPGTKQVDSGACVKPGDRHFAECGAKKLAPIESALQQLKADLAAATDEAKKADLQVSVKEKQEDLGRYTCASSFKCVEGAFCSLTSPQLAELAAQHFQIWIKAQPSDEEIKKKLVEVMKEVDAAKKANNNAALAEAQRRQEELSTKDLTRKQMTSLWLDSEQYGKALEYWEGLLKDQPNNTEIMGTLAYIHLRAGDWRKSIEKYNQVAATVTDPGSKVAAYQFIGNVAWAKLNTRTLVGADAVELADRGLGALQRASAAQPENSKVVSLQGALLNFRSTAHGASWAGAIDRASAQDQAKRARVLAEEAKKNQPQAPGTPAAPAAPSAPAGAASSAPAGAAPSAPSSGAQPGTPPSPPAAGGSAKTGG